ncbi:MAG: response regulator transcription factor [Clostridiales bacterium]|nr:response regulator transcription factor [Clostridiales bacterium]
MKILIAEDTKDLNHAVGVLLTHEGYDVDQVYDGQEALDLILTTGYDAIILDIMMPRLDGISVLTTLRERNIMTPVMLLTAKADVDDRVAGLDAGADDYLPKPFAMKELLARIRAMIRRGGDYSSDKLIYAGLCLNGDDLSLSSGNTVRLSIKEYELMRELMLNPERPLTMAHILEKVWKSEQDIGDEAVWLYISYLKNKLRSVVSPVVILGEKEGPFTLTHE